MSALRRTFLKLTGSAVTAFALANKLNCYAEQEEVLPIDNTTKTDWIVDKGNYYLVTVPSNKTLKNESFDKPVLFVLREAACVSGVAINGFTTIICENTGWFSDSIIDCTNTLLSNPRAAVVFDKNISGLVFNTSTIECGPSTTYAIEMQRTERVSPLLNKIAGIYMNGYDSVHNAQKIQQYKANGFVLPNDREKAAIYVGDNHRLDSVAIADARI